MILSRLPKLAIIALFMAILTLPIFQMTFDVFSPYPIFEGRKLASWQDAPGYASPEQFLNFAAKWFRDNYGLREWLIRGNNQLNYSFFGVSDGNYIGYNGWLYYRSEIDLEERPLTSMSSRRFNRVMNNIESLRDILSVRGVELIIITNQMKGKFYPEHFPIYAAKLNEKRRFDEVRERLHSTPSITYIDTTPSLLVLKWKRPIFHQTDIHWNDPAAFETAKTVVEKISEFEHRTTSIWSHELKIAYLADFAGFESARVPLLTQPKLSEQALYVDPNWPPAKEDMPPHTVSPTCPFESITTGPNSREALLPTTVMYGDSFADGLSRSGMNSYFSHFLRSRWGHSYLEDTLTRMPPETKYFIFQFIESHFLSFENVKLPSADRLMTSPPCEGAIGSTATSPG
jgi:hypothetical protein